MVIIVTIIRPFLRQIMRRIMTPDKTEIISENTEMIAKRPEHNEERNERFLPIFLWTD